MSYKIDPFKGTVVFGVCAAIFFAPLNFTLNFVLNAPLAFRFAIIMVLFAYGLYLAKKADKKTGQLIFPIVILVIAQFYIYSQTAFLALSLAMLSWIRSGMFFPSGPFKTLISEAMTSFGGGLLIYYFNPTPLGAWSLAIWLFFLIQSMFFLFFKYESGPENDKKIHDPFENAKKQVEKILDPI